MSVIAEILTKVESSGVEIYPNGSNLDIVGQLEDLTTDLINELRENKSRLLDYLRGKQSDIELYGQSLDELKLLAADDWSECKNDPKTLEAFAKSVATRKLRGQGIKPDNYIQACHCQQCGPIFLWKGAPTIVDGCPWCFNRIAGISIPRPAPIK